MELPELCDKLRQIMALIALSISAYTDIKERNIYIYPLIFLSTGGLCVSLSAYFYLPLSEMNRYLCGYIMAPLVTGIIVIGITYMLKDYIGPGDGYLYAAVGIMTGVITNTRLICLAFVLCGMFGIIILFMGICENDKRIPFAPFYLLGYMIILTMGVFD